MFFIKNSPIQKAILKRDVSFFFKTYLAPEMSDNEIRTWCDDNVGELAYVYYKYYDADQSWEEAEKHEFFVESTYGRDDLYTIIESFVDFQ
tara:strand:+ start:474 stop:746 length:273 start_codon:yes stop_codon:yes gene_type:complete